MSAFALLFNLMFYFFCVMIIKKLIFCLIF